MVAFRSVRRPDADEARLTEYDDWAHEEAMTAPASCTTSRAPRPATGRACPSACGRIERPHALRRVALGHAQAAALAHEMYARYDLEFHRVTKRTGGPFSFEPYDQAPTPRFAPGLAAS